MLQNAMYFTESFEYIYMYRQDPRYLHTCIFNGYIRACSNGTCLFFTGMLRRHKQELLSVQYHTC